MHRLQLRKHESYLAACAFPSVKSAKQEQQLVNAQHQYWRQFHTNFTVLEITNSPSMATFPKRFSRLLSEVFELLTIQTCEHWAEALSWLLHERMQLCTYLDTEEWRKLPVRFAAAQFGAASLGGVSRIKFLSLHTTTVFFLSNWQKTRALCRHWSLPGGPPCLLKLNPITQSRGGRFSFREPGQQMPWTRCGLDTSTVHLDSSNTTFLCVLLLAQIFSGIS